QWENQETLKNATNQLGEVITRDKNRASVIIWSMANETPVRPSRLNFIRSLIDYIRSRDDSRLISAALEKHTKSGSTNIQVVEDPLAEYIDILGINEYIGWYGGTPLDIAATEWEINYTKPLIISEFGGGALQGFHGDKGTRWTEEFQEELYRETIIMLDKIPQYSGVTPWILTDFRSPRRMLPGIQDGWNRKGLISETGDKKKAFGVLKLYYDSKEEEYKFKKGLK
ncbi:MAG: beta-glucuronidase, partial [Bacteroidia bacterium]